MSLIILAAIALVIDPLNHSSPSCGHQGTVVRASATEALNMPGYCGVFALYRGMVALGQRPKFGEFLKPAYITAPAKGSSVEQLMMAAENMGVECRHLTHLNSSALKCIDSPTLLHVKANVGSSAYDHWVLFLGVEQEMARLADGTQDVQLMDFRDLSARWDGHALILNAGPGLYRKLVLAVLTPYGWMCAAALMLMIAVRSGWRRSVAGWLKSRRVVWQNYALQAFAVVGVGLLAADALDIAGFLSAPTAIAAIQEQKLGNFLPTVSADQIAASGNMVVVDARWKRDFEAGHIPDAVNIQSTTTPERCLVALHDVSKDTPIVIYCQSNGCPFSARVARCLTKCGFKNLYLFPGGWLEWQARKD
jgi:rhodanese-related sulfurtransferase